MRRALVDAMAAFGLCKFSAEEGTPVVSKPLAEEIARKGATETIWNAADRKPTTTGSESSLGAVFSEGITG